jgi:NAD(P)-dependent dehydrogenase (short-subunit alcohol dehydrogenase family)
MIDRSLREESMPSVLVTGANRGIGLEFVKQYAAEGWRVFAVCRDAAKATDLNDLAKASGVKVTVHEAEVTDAKALARLADALKGQPIDLLMNNAGIAVRDAMTFGDSNAESWLRAFNVNCIAPTKVAEALLPNLLAGDQKIVAMMSSRLGSHAYNSGGWLAYRATKAALNSVVLTMKAELGPKGVITVALHPGHVATDMGGASAPVMPSQSVTGLRKVLSGLNRKQNGSFYDYTGAEIAW